MISLSDYFDKTIAVSALTLLLGVGIGIFGSSDLLPPKIITKTVAGPSVDVPGPATTPQSCRDALDAADKMQEQTTKDETSMTNMLSYNMQVMNALSAGNTAAALDAVMKATAEPLPSSDTTAFAKYLSSSSACRG